jgi:hypothetical protein
MKVQLELDVFSGRPNPSWDLDEATGRRLVELLDKATSAPSSAEQPPPLGFRGFVVVVSDRSEVRRFRVFGGTVVVDGRAFPDPDRSIEKLVRASLPQTIREEFSDLL